MLSIVVPAHNEESVLAATLRALCDAVAALGEPFELIVVDDSSTDRTPEIARAFGATVVPVRLRHIGATRNAGARIAKGDVVIFVDADTIVPAAALRAVRAALDAGAVGGGAGVRADRAEPWWGPAVIATIAWLMRRLRLAAGCFLFARREVFERVGGFDERFLVSEEIHLSRALKKHGPFVIVRDAVITSGRKGRLMPARAVLRQFFVVLWPPSLKKRDRLPFWYGGEREHDEGS
jgi:glycosyltransferase involved in cell wall biosynthesis